MRITLFIDSLKAGGAQRQFTLLARGLADRGHQVALVTLFPEGHYWKACLDQSYCDLHALYERRGGTMVHRVLQLLNAPRRLARFLRAEQMDVLYSALHTSDLLACLAAHLAGRAAFAWSVRTSNQNFPWKQRPSYELCRLLSSAVPLMTANSKSGLDDYLSRGFRPRSSTVIPNGIDVDMFRPDEKARAEVRSAWQVADDALLIGIVGRLAPVKKHGAFIQAAAAIAARYPTARFVCVGDGPPDYAASLKAQAAAKGLDDRLIWGGLRDDMTSVYNAMDILCLSSEAEGFPNVVAEAMATAVPCVAFDVGDIAEIIGTAGVVVPAGDTDRLGQGLADMLDLSGESRRQLGDDSRRRIQQDYSLDAMVNRTETYLSGIATG